jgi:hypothetical protein
MAASASFNASRKGMALSRIQQFYGKKQADVSAGECH